MGMWCSVKWYISTKSTILARFIAGGAMDSSLRVSPGKKERESVCVRASVGVRASTCVCVCV